MRRRCRPRGGLRLACWLLLGALLRPAPASAQDGSAVEGAPLPGAAGTALAGATVGEVRIEAPAGVDVRDLKDLVSAAGPDGGYSPLAVRRSIELLYRLGVFESVTAEAALDEARVDVVFRLEPAPVISGIRIRGNPAAVPDAALAAALAKGPGDRYARGDAEIMARDLEIALEREGYRAARATPIEEVTLRGDRVRLRFDVAPGARHVVTEVRVNLLPEGTPTDPAISRLLGRRTGVRSLEGERYRKARAESEATDLLADLRRAGWREARLSVRALEAEAPSGVVLVFDLVLRDRVSVTFRGVDFRPDRSRLTRAIAFQQETSFTDGYVEDAEERLLEDLRRGGWLDARVSGRREVRGASEGTVLVFELERGRRARLAPRDIRLQGNETLPRLEVLQVLTGASPDVLGRRRYTAEESTRAAAALEEYYASRGFGGARVRPCAPDRPGDPAPPPAGAVSDPAVHPGAAVRLGEGPGPSRTIRLGLVFCVEEGARARVEGIDLEPLPEETLSRVPAEEVLAPFRPLRGQYLDLSRLRAAEATVRRAYQQKGYPDAEVKAGVADPAGGERVRVRVAVTPGERAVVGHVVVQGNRVTRLGLIRSEFGLEPGVPFDPVRLQEGQRRLLATNLFSVVRAAPLATEGRVRDVLVEVRERPPYRLELGGGASTDEGLRLVAEQRLSNIGGLAQRWTTLVQWGVSWTDLPLLFETGGSSLPRPEWKLATGWEFPWIPAVPLKISLKGLLNERDKETTYALRRWGLGVGLSGRLQPGVDLLGQFDLHWRYPDYSDPAVVLAPDPDGDGPRISPDAADPDFEPGLLGILGAEAPPASQVRAGVLSLQAIADLRDDRFNPSSGIFGSLLFDAALPAPVSQETWFGVQARLSGWLRLYDPAKRVPFNLQSTVQFGFVMPYGDSAQVMLERRYRLGGSSTIRGFATGTVGPTVTRQRLLVPLGVDSGTTRVSVGGNLFYALNLEFHFPLRRDRAIEAVVFGDAGTALLTQRTDPVCDGCALDPGSAEPAWSIGAGLRYRTPIGPLALDVGASPQRFATWLDGGLPDGETFWALHFSIGTF